MWRDTGAITGNRATCMPTVPMHDEHHRILAVIADHPAGIGVDALHGVLQTMARRSLQRRLAELVVQQRLVREGAGRAMRYRMAPAAVVGAPDIPLSAEGETIRTYVRRPQTQRRPVAYDLRFLEAYTPNHSFYLDASLREQLWALGRSSAGPQAPAGTFARDILHRLLIDLSWASSQLEGNTYTRLDTERLIEFGQAAAGKDALETQMILNHKAAIEFLVGEPSVAVDTATVIALHALLSDGLMRDPLASGRVRERAVEIGSSVYRPIALPQRLQELFGIVMRMAAEIEDAFEQAFFLMVHLPYLQPFEDVNKRVSRLAANLPLLRHNLCPLSFIDVPAQAYIDGTLGVYELARVELLRDVFVWAYERSCQQYVAVKQQLVPPDLFRLRYRAEISAAVKALVQQTLALNDVNLAQVTPASVAVEDRIRFATQLRLEFDTLHSGNAVRFGLRPLELAAWQDQFRPHGPGD